MVSSALVSAMSDSGQPKKSRSGTTRSASWPAAICPLLPCSFENQVTFSVHMRSAASRSRQLRCGVICRPPTVRPVTSQDSDTHGLYEATRVASVPAETFMPRRSISATGGVASAARAP